MSDHDLAHRDPLPAFLISLGAMIILAAILGVVAWWLGVLCVGAMDIMADTPHPRASRHAATAILYTGAGALFCSASTLALIYFAIKFTYARFCTKPSEPQDDSVRPAFPAPRRPRP